MFLTVSGSHAIDELLLHLECDDPLTATEKAAAGCGEVLTGILHGCELARRLENDLPSIASQTHLLLLSCQEIAAAFEAAADRLSLSRSASPKGFDLQEQHRHSPTTSQQYQYNNSFPPTPQEQYLRYASAPPTPHEYQQQYCYSNPPTPPNYTYLYQQPAQSTPASSSDAAAGLLDVECYGADEMDSTAQLLADVDLDFLSANEFHFVDADGARFSEIATVAAEGQQHNGGCDEVSCAWGSAAAAAMMNAAEGVLNSDCTVGQVITPEVGTADGNKVNSTMSGKTCPQTEGASRSRLSRKRKDSSGESNETRTIHLPAPRTGDMEAPPEDGYTWRKYGHKDILHARFPRCYYRCIHKSSCDAKKQVQRLDSDPFTYEITYYGHHTCRATQDNANTNPAAALATGHWLPTAASLGPQSSDSSANLYAPPAAKASRRLV